LSEFIAESRELFEKGLAGRRSSMTIIGIMLDMKELCREIVFAFWKVRILHHAGKFLVAKD